MVNAPLTKELMTLPGINKWHECIMKWFNRWGLTPHPSFLPLCSCIKDYFYIASLISMRFIDNRQKF